MRRREAGRGGPASRARGGALHGGWLPPGFSCGHVHKLDAKACLAALCALLAVLAWPAAAESPGERLARQVYDRPDGDDVVIRAKMVLTQPGHSPRERAMFTYAKDNEAGDFWSLVRFTAPADIRDTGLLSISLANGEESQWIYLPALGRNRRIPANRQGGRFVGSDLYYEDLQDRKVEKDHHEVKGQGEVAGLECTVLESVPKDRSSSAYDRWVSCIHPQILITLETEFYEGGKREPTKRLTVRKVQKIQGYWTVVDSTMKDLESGHETRIAVQAIGYDQGLPDELFSPRALQDPSIEERYRP